MNFKRIFIAVAAIVSLLLLCFVIYYRISINKANSVPIHNDANWVIKIDGVEIGKELLGDLLFGGGDRGLTDSTQFRVVRGMTIPLLVYVYNTKEHPTSFFTAAILHDEKVLMSNLKHQNTWVPVDTFEHIYKNTESNFYITYNRTHVFIAWNLNSPSAIRQFWEIAAGTNTTPYRRTSYYEELLGKGIVAATNHIDNFFLDFKEDEIEIEGLLSWARHPEAPLHLHKNSVKEHALWYSCIHTQTDLGLNSFVKFVPAVDSFMQVLIPPGNTNFCLQFDTTLVKYKETSVSYEYDDNFTKITKELIVEHETPRVIAGFCTNGDLRYFADGSTSLVSRTYFPLFPLYYRNYGAYNVMSNADRFRNEFEQSRESSCAFQWYTNVSQLKNFPPFNNYSGYIDILSNIDLSGAYTGNDQIAVSGKIQLLPRHQNALKTIYRHYSNIGFR